MNSDTASFSLLTSPWIKVLWHDGHQGEVSILEAFENADAIAEITGDIPQQSGVLLRLLDAIMRRAYGRSMLDRFSSIDLWLSMWERGSFDMDILSGYLDEYAGSFDLFGPKPFYQISDLEYASEKAFDPVSSLMADVPSKPEKHLFSLRGIAAPNRMTFAEAARWLVFTQAYDIAGIKTPVVGNTHAKNGKAYAPKGIPGTGYLGNLGLVYLEGRNLFETLMWNFVLFDDARADVCFLGSQEDLPPWEKDESSPNSRELLAPTGLVQLETLQSRRVRLITSDGGNGVIGFISCYGDLLHPVDAMKYETMASMKQSEPQRVRLKLPVAPFMPRTHDAKRAMWRGLSGLLAVSVGVDQGLDDRPGVIRWMNIMADELAEVDDDFCDLLPKQVAIHAQGIEYGTQSSVYVDSFDDRLQIGSALAVHDDEAVRLAIELADKADSAIFEVVKLVRASEESKGDKASKDIASARAQDVLVAAYAEVDALFRAYLAGLTVGEDFHARTLKCGDAIRRSVLRIGFDAAAQSNAQEFVTHSGHSVAYAKSQFVQRVNKLLPSSE